MTRLSVVLPGTVGDEQAKAITEMHRVHRPGGRLPLLDHVGSTWPPIFAVQWLIERFTVRGADDHMTRRQLPLVKPAGFIVEEVERLKADTVERVAARKAPLAVGRRSPTEQMTDE
jgi:hypothetical protein